MSTATYLRTRVDRAPIVPALLVGDVGAILLFVGIGINSHGGDPLGEPAHLVLTAAPFLLSWLLVALLGGLYTTDAVLGLRRALSWTVPAWVVAALLGQGLRATPWFPGDTAVTFAIVSIVAGGALLTGWRLGMTLVLEIVPGLRET